jgi:PTS system nitrogen regulatory IIA component
VDLVFLLLQPATSPGDLNSLAAVARKLREPERLKRLRTASDAAALYREIAA